MLFELGARLYPPRDLYLAYLRQSDVFVRVNDEGQIVEHWVSSTPSERWDSSGCYAAVSIDARLPGHP